MLFVFLTTVLREGTVALRPEVVLPQQLLLVVLLGPLDEPRVQRERSARRTAEFERSPRARNRTSGEAPCGPSTTRPRGFACCRRRASALRQTDRRVLPRRNQAARIIRASISSTGAVPTVFNALARKYVSCSPKAIRTHSGSFTKSGERWFKPPAAWRSPVVSVPLCRAQLHCDPSLFTLRVDRHLFCVQNKPNDRMPTFPC